jgi:hypothetical protein
LFLVFLFPFCLSELWIETNPSTQTLINSSTNCGSFCLGFHCLFLDCNAPDLNNASPNFNYNTLVSNVDWNITASDLETGLKDCNALFFKNNVFVGNFNADKNFTTDGNNFGTCKFDQNLNAGDSDAFITWRICDYALNCSDLNSFKISYPIPSIISGLLFPLKIVKIQEGNFWQKLITPTEPINLFFMLFIIIILTIIVYLAYRKFRKKEIPTTA